MPVLRAAVAFFCDILTFLLFARAILSWFVNPYSYSPYSVLHRINALLRQLTEPMVAPCRRLLSNFSTGMFDFSVLVAMLAVMLVRNVVLMLLRML
ncbi:MAG: YggT family protein [Clostridiales Family XIII bacterium]|jgi:YggT family protein|nr:YggT family protein [Clostridiales Family XIII bacterium]